MEQSLIQTLQIIAKYGLNRPFKVRPNMDFRCVVSSTPPLDSKKVYTVEFATNQPDYIVKGLVFCGEFLLSGDEYTLVNSI